MPLASIYVPATSQHERQFVSFCAGSQLYVWCRQKGEGEGGWTGPGGVRWGMSASVGI